MTMLRRGPGPADTGRLARSIWPSIWLTVTLAPVLAGCGGGGGSEATFKPLSYTYLTPLRLNVGQIQIQDDVPPPANPSDLGPDAPVPPDQALKQMAQDRLVAAGNSGTAVFTIDQGGITGAAGGTLDGTMTVHLDIISNSGGHVGYAEAHVAREFVPGSGSGDGGLKSQLYDLTRQMMQDMNVELEFQMRRSLGDWMLDASGVPVASGVEQQPLSGPAAGATPPPVPAAPAPASVGAPVQLAPPPSAVPPDAVSMPAAPVPDAVPADPTQSLSPPPGVLQAPPGAVPTPSQDGAPVPLAPASTVAPALQAPAPAAAAPMPASAPTGSAYHGHYPTPPGYHPSAGAGTSANDGSATPAGY